jgi:hypothetical protein
MPLRCNDFYRKSVGHYIFVDLENIGIASCNMGEDSARYWAKRIGAGYDEFVVITYAVKRQDYDDVLIEKMKAIENYFHYPIQQKSGREPVDAAIFIDSMWVANQGARGKTISTKKISVISNDKDFYILINYLASCGMDAILYTEGPVDEALRKQEDFAIVRPIRKDIRQYGLVARLPSRYDDAEVDDTAAYATVLTPYNSIGSSSVATSVSVGATTPKRKTVTKFLTTRSPSRAPPASLIYDIDVNTWYTRSQSYFNGVSGRKAVDKERNNDYLLYEYSQLGTFIAQNVVMPTGKAARKGLVAHIAALLIDHEIIEPVDVASCGNGIIEEITRISHVTDRINRVKKVFPFIIGGFKKTT